MKLRIILPKLNKFFSKLMIHINDLIDNFEKSVDSDMSSEELSTIKNNNDEPYS